jgi:hypothetical protein
MGIRIIGRSTGLVPVVYVTRFNIANAFRAPPRRPLHLDPAWLDERIALFERYCVPKMATQSDDRFRWLILISPETDAAILRRLARAPNAELVPVAPEAALAQAVAARIATLGDSVITARVDSDDQLSTRFTKALREIDWDRRREFALYFTKGLYFETASGSYRVVRAALNQFPAVFEHRPDREFRTVHLHQHNHLFKSMDAIMINGKHPMWCTIVHGGNIANRMIGKPTQAPPEDW